MHSWYACIYTAPTLQSDTESFKTQVFSAWPISNWWTKQAGYDLNYGAFLTAFAAMDILFDILILALPLPVIKSLHMSRKRKFTVIGIFWLGGL